MSDSGDAPAVKDGRVTDVDGHEVDDTTLDWLTFIALHMDEDRDFGAAELLDDVLLALGYRDHEERERRSEDGSAYPLALERALDDLVDVGLAERHAERDFPHFRLTDDVVDDIRTVRSRIGQFWGFAGSRDAIDSYAELGLLVIIALRIQEQNRASRDDLVDKLVSLLGDRDDDATRTDLTNLMARLKSRDFVDTKTDFTELKWDGIVALRRLDLGWSFGTDWTLDDKAWGGLYSLRDTLQGEFEGLTLTSVRPASSGAPSRRSDTVQRQSGSPAQQKGRATRGRVASRQTPRRVAKSTTTPIVSDLDLCVATLESLAENSDGRQSFTEQEIGDKVIGRLNIPPAYVDQPLPPWAEGSLWANDLVKSRAQDDPGNDKYSPTLLDYRMEHVFRALSIEQTSWIQDAGLTSAQQHAWFLTEQGRAIVDSADFKDGLFDAISEGTDAYFRMHRYVDWKHEQWMTDVVNMFDEMGASAGGAAFEYLMKDLIEAGDVEKGTSVVASVEPHNSYLDRAGVDIVVNFVGGRLGGFGGGSALLVQCKRHFVHEIPPDAASKLFATTAWLRGQADRGAFKSNVLGARVAFLGDLSREATWTFWALKSAWSAIEGAAEEARLGAEQSALIWEIWDGRKVFDLMYEHETGVHIGDDGVVSVDEGYLHGLAERAGT